MFRKQFARFLSGLFLLFVLVFTSCATSQDSLSAVRSRGVLLVGATGDYRPMSFLDPESGEYVGFDAALAEDLASSLGVRLEFVPTTWPTLMDDTLAGKFDLAVCGITSNQVSSADVSRACLRVNWARLPVCPGGCG